MSKLNSATSWDQILGIGSPPKEDISGQERHPGASAPEKRVWLPGSTGSEQTRAPNKGEIWGGRSFNDGEGDLCLCLVPVRQVADSSPLSLQTQPCQSGNGRNPRPAPGDRLLE